MEFDLLRSLTLINKLHGHSMFGSHSAFCKELLPGGGGGRWCTCLVEKIKRGIHVECSFGNVS